MYYPVGETMGEQGLTSEGLSVSVWVRAGPYSLGSLFGWTKDEHVVQTRIGCNEEMRVSALLLYRCCSQQAMLTCISDNGDEANDGLRAWEGASALQHDNDECALTVQPKRKPQTLKPLSR